MLHNGIILTDPLQSKRRQWGLTWTVWKIESGGSEQLKVVGKKNAQKRLMF